MLDYTLGSNFTFFKVEKERVLFHGLTHLDDGFRHIFSVKPCSQRSVCCSRQEGTCSVRGQSLGALFFSHGGKTRHIWN